MARSKSPNAQLFDLLTAAPDPIYVLDDGRAIVFCNQALADWTGLSADELIGRRLDYHSQPSEEDDGGATGDVAGLCPPPASFAGQDAVGHVSALDADGRSHHRQARFAPLGHADGETDADCHGVAVFVGPRDLSAAELVALTETDVARTGDMSSDAVHLAIRRFRQQQGRRYAIERLLGVSPPMQRVRRQVALAAGAMANVTIVGPPGSGREHVALTIHYAASRNETTDLLPLDCGLVTTDTLRRSIETLIADASPESAPTLVLGEIDRLSHEQQIGLMDLVATAEVPVRVLATSSRDLGELAASGVFLGELACRFSTITIRLPSLSERIDDLPLLAHALLEGQNAISKRQVGGIAPDVLDQLTLYPWPGEIDELAEAIAAAHAACETAEIQLADLPAKFRHAAEIAARPRQEHEQIVLDEFLADIEMELITRALSNSGGNKAQAARDLGMTRPRLYRRLVQLGLASGSNDDADRPAAGDS